MANELVTLPGPIWATSPSAPLVLCGVYNATQPTGPDGSIIALQVDSHGQLKTSGGGGGGGGTVQIEDTNGNALNSNGSGSLNVAITSGGTGGGTVVQGNQGSIGQSWFVEVTDGTNVLGTSSHPFRIDPTGATVQPVSGTFWQATQPVSGTFWQATQPISGAISFTAPQHVIVDSGTITTVSTVTAVTTVSTVTSLTAIANALPAGTNTIGNVGIVPATSGGCSIYHLVSAGSTNQNNIKASAGQVYGYIIFNNGAYPVYVKLYNNSGTPTAGTGVIQTFGVQAGTGREVWFDQGLAYGTGIGITITKGIADADATAVLANDCVAEIYYK